MPLSPVAVALVGCSFFGSASYFLYSLAFPVWQNAFAQLWGFLAYDLVLIVPFAVRLGSIDSAHLPALLLNTAVLVYSGILAIYYLLIAKATRIWARHPLRASSKNSPPAKQEAASTVGSAIRARYYRDMDQRKENNTEDNKEYLASDIAKSLTRIPPHTCDMVPYAPASTVEDLDRARDTSILVRASEGS